MDLEWDLVDETDTAPQRHRIVRRTFRAPGGETVDREILEQGAVVAVVAQTAGGAFLLARQFRPGPGRVLLDLPGGFVDDGEAPDAAARRELREETGWEAANVEIVGMTWLAAFSTMRRYAAVATGCVHAGPADPEDARFVDVESLSAVDFRRHVLSGALTDVDLACLGLEALGLL